MLTLMQPGHTRALGENVQKININASLDLESAESQYYKIGIKKKNMNGIPLVFTAGAQ